MFSENRRLMFLSAIQFIETRYCGPIGFPGRQRRACMCSDDVAHLLLGSFDGQMEGHSSKSTNDADEDGKRKDPLALCRQ